MLNAISTSASNLSVTLPGFIYYGLSNLYNRFTANKLNNAVMHNQQVVVFVHGRGGHYTDFNTLIDNLHQEPQLASYHLKMVDLGNTRYTSIDTDVARLHTELTPFQNCSIILVGNSKGGVVVMRYATTMNDYRIKKVITIASPLQGTMLASVFPQSSIVHQELKYQSDITTNIFNTPLSIPIYNIVSRWDHLIIPYESACYPTTPKERIYTYEGNKNHAGICCDMEIAKVITKWIVANE